MSSDVADALEAMRTIMKGTAPADVTALKNAHVYPDDFVPDYPEPNVRDYPFMIIQESVGRTSSFGDIPTGGDTRGWHDWAIELVLFLSNTEAEWPSPQAALAEYQHRNWAIEINNTLARNQTLGETVFAIGEKRGGAFAFADYLIDHEQWNKTLGWAIRFLVPVTQIYDRGG